MLVPARQVLRLQLCGNLEVRPSRREGGGMNKFKSRIVCRPGMSEADKEEGIENDLSWSQRVQ